MDWDTVTWREFEDVLIRYRDQFYRGNPPEEQYYVRAFRVFAGLPITEKPNHVDQLLLWLNQWKCRFSRVTAPQALAAWIRDEAPALEQLARHSIADAAVPELREHFDRLHESLIELKRAPVAIHNMSDACASKTLHMMIPPLFVMWDVNIRQWGVGSYGRFMTRMHGFAVRLRDDLAPTEARPDLEDYLQRRLEYPVRKSLAKYIDEYNWYLAVGHNRDQF